MSATGSVLLDTNILIAYLTADPAVTRGVHAAAMVYVPAIALGELYYGARKSARVVKGPLRLRIRPPYAHSPSPAGPTRARSVPSLAFT